jgi:CRP-like cAMP-binding protein
MPFPLVLSQVSQIFPAPVFMITASSALRLEKFLDWLVFRFGTPAPQGYLVEIRLTHQDISEAIGSTRVSVTRVLNQFQQAGKIKWSSHRLLVLQ